MADLARYQLMNVNDPSQLRAEPAGVRGLPRGVHHIGAYLPITDPADADVYTALIAGLVAQQLANDPEDSGGAG